MAGKIPLTIAVMMLGACASQVDAVRGAVDEAPDWFQQRRTELRGEDYPSIVEVPTVLKRDRPAISEAGRATRMAGLKAEFLSDPRAEAPNQSRADIEKWVAEKKALFAGIEPPAAAEFDRSAAEVFNSPRASLPSGTKR